MSEPKPTYDTVSATHGKYADDDISLTAALLEERHKDSEPYPLVFRCPCCGGSLKLERPAGQIIVTEIQRAQPVKLNYRRQLPSLRKPEPEDIWETLLPG
jgi:hypothetical protein